MTFDVYYLLVPSADVADSKTSASHNQFYTANEFTPPLPSAIYRPSSPSIGSAEHPPEGSRYTRRSNKYNDGGPGPDEPKSVLPEPKALPLTHRRYSLETEVDSAMSYEGAT